MHVLELNIKHVAKVLAENVSGRKQTGPVNTLFKRMQDNWPELMPMIDLADLNKFNWRDVAGTEIEDQAEKALAILSNFLKEKSVAREDYKEFCELAVMFLGGAVDGFYSCIGPVVEY